MHAPEEMSPLWRLARAREREHVLTAVALAQSNWRLVAETVASAVDAANARSQLSALFDLDDIQAAAVLDVQYRRLSSEERRRVDSELLSLQAEIDDLRRLIDEDPDRAWMAPVNTTDDPEGHGWWAYEPPS